MLLKKFKEELTSNENDILNSINNLPISYSGGIDGNEITFKIVDEMHSKMKKNSILFLLLIKENYPTEFFKRYTRFNVTLLSKETYYNEEISIFKCVKD